MKKGLETERESGKVSASPLRRDRVVKEKRVAAARNVTQETPSTCKPVPAMNETENNR